MSKPSELLAAVMALPADWRKRAGEVDDGSGISACAQLALHYRHRANELDYELQQALPELEKLLAAMDKVLEVGKDMRSQLPGYRFSAIAWDAAVADLRRGAGKEESA